MQFNFGVVDGVFEGNCVVFLDFELVLHRSSVHLLHFVGLTEEISAEDFLVGLVFEAYFQKM